MIFEKALRSVRVCLAIGMLLGVATGAGAADTRAQPEFALGQEWSIRSPKPTTAKVVVGRIEHWNGKVVVHISIIDIPIPAGLPGAPGVTAIDHVPLEKSALASSVGLLLTSNSEPAPGFQSGYELWQSAPNAGVFNVVVYRVIELMFGSITRGGSQSEGHASAQDGTAGFQKSAGSPE